METKPEVAMIKANTSPIGGLELYWLLSRNQLEFILQDIKVFHSPPLVPTAQYQEVMLPVINLEEYFGLPETVPGRSLKYLVIRALTGEKSLVRVIIRTIHPLKLQKLEAGFGAVRQVSLPRNSNHLLGIFVLANGGLGVVPDVAGISLALR
jgi:hypothetical protein